MIIFIVPKNSGLAITKEIAEDYTGEILEVRGEDIPLFVEELSKQNKKVIGITGDDLLKEFLIRRKNTCLEIKKVISWKDEKCIFGKPTLCLMGSEKENLGDISKTLKICINRKYLETAEKYLKKLEKKGFRFEKFYLSGATESMFQKGLVDLVIDIVCSGKSAEEAGLKVYDRIFSSDIVVISCKAVVEK